MRSPVTHPDWSEARKSATLAMSSGLPIRPIGSEKPSAFALSALRPAAGEAFGLSHAWRDGVDPDSLAGKLSRRARA